MLNNDVKVTLVLLNSYILQVSLYRLNFWGFEHVHTDCACDCTSICS